ncbi:MAG: epimerase [Saccharospirillaceae bacterium]|nr:hypothetical protein [Pseudomonadales bacterium]NRB78900.1 epimerase [Saccharospirillaceae bacterium]
MTTSIKTALIIGCGGTFGSAVAKELQTQGWIIKALMRNPTKKPDWLENNQIIQGDCQVDEDLSAAIDKFENGVDLIVYGANPKYTQWHQKCLKMLEPTIKIAEQQKLHILFPGNVYGYNPIKTPLINERSNLEPVTDKGQIRNQMELRLKQACENGATVTLVRCGDFIAQNSESSAFNILLKKTKKGWSIANPSPKNHRHTFAWLPDVAINAVALVKADKNKQTFNSYHLAGLQVSHVQIKQTLETLGFNVKESKFPWWMLKIMAVFIPMLKEICKMSYLWRQELLMDESKMQKVLAGEVKNSSLLEVMKKMTTSD